MKNSEELVVKIVVTATGSNLDARTSPRFGRCPIYMFVETETMAFEALPNPALDASGGAGVLTAQVVVERGAQAVLSGNLGPNAMEVLQAAGVPAYLVGEGTVREAVEAYKAGQVEPLQKANVRTKAGLGQRRQAIAAVTSRQQEITDLRIKAADLRRQLSDVIERIEKLEKES
jgi:predicted Fe-Mo cluster-binding NifX family protein